MQPTPLRAILWFVPLIVFWAAFGLVGRDAWRHEEALALAPVLDWLEGATSAWATPAPLHTWVAGQLARLGAGYALDTLDGARLASGLFTLTALLCLGLTARSLFGAGFAVVAVLALQGAFGLMLLAHALLPDSALLAAWSALLLGVAVARQRPVAGGLFIAGALTALTLGLRGAQDLAIGALLALLPLLSPAWRTRAYLRAVALGLGLAAAAITATLFALGQAELLNGWLRWHAGAGFPPPRAPANAYAELAWFAWPLWPLALAAVWHEHRRLLRSETLHMPLTSLAALSVAALYPAWSRDGALLPVLLPLALLAAHAIDGLRRGAASAFYWFGVLCFLFFASAFWLYFAAIEWGVPTRLATHMARLVPGYAPGSVDRGSLMIAIVLTVGWLVAIPLFPRAKSRPILVWATGMILLWGLLVALFRPWIDAGWGYRPLIHDLARHLPADACLDARVDPAMTTMLRLYGSHPVRADCPWVLLALDRKAGEHRADDDFPGMRWEGQRPRQKAQLYRLYRVDNDDAR